MSIAVAAPPSHERQKPLRRRRAPGVSQRLRRSFQLAFLALNIWIGIQFYFFVRYYETGGRTLWAPRPPGIEGWLPIASLMNLKLFLATGEVPRVHPAGLFVLVSFLAISWLLCKSFCSWLCPVGTISEYLWRLGKQTFGRNFRLPRRLDLVLRGIKYILLGLFLYAVGSMPASAINSFLDGPYGLIDDVEMLNFFRFLGLIGGVILAILVLASVFVQNFWCRYLCPYGALMGLPRCLAPSASSATRSCASIAENARRLALRCSPSTAWSPFVPQSASDAWNAYPSVPPPALSRCQVRAAVE